MVDPPRPLPWYPQKLAWHMNFTRNQLRKLSWLADIHEFMKAANEAGSITRQEAVSMVPPLFMDVKPHHRVRGGLANVLLLFAEFLETHCDLVYGYLAPMIGNRVVFPISDVCVSGS